jgi:hypothetical protein
MTVVDTKSADWHLPISKLELEAACSDIKVDLVNSAIKQSVSKDWLPIILTAYEELLPMISVDSKRDFDSSNQCVDGWIALIKEELYANPSVEDIFIDIEDNEVDVWVVIPERDLSILHQIVETEGKLFDTLASGENPPFLIEFHVIYRCGRNVEELAPTRAIRLPR